MTCRCTEDSAPKNTLGTLADVPHTKHPNTYCPHCAEKHLSTANSFAREYGYETPNRQFIIGELVAASWHLAGQNDQLAAKIRLARHQIQNRSEHLVQWIDLILELNALVESELAKFPTA